MARTVPERWVNAVITFTVVMDVSPDASAGEKIDAAFSVYEERFPDFGDDCVATVRSETVGG